MGPCSIYNIAHEKLNKGGPKYLSYVSRKNIKNVLNCIEIRIL